MQDEQFRALLDRDDVKTIVFHDNATDEIAKMHDACVLVGMTHGYDSTEYRDMIASLHKCLGLLLRRGFSRRMYITKDGNLSLYCQDGDFVMGMVFHRDRKWDNPPEGQQQPGTWSLHS